MECIWCIYPSWFREDAVAREKPIPDTRWSLGPGARRSIHHSNRRRFCLITTCPYCFISLHCCLSQRYHLMFQSSSSPYRGVCKGTVRRDKNRRTRRACGRHRRNGQRQRAPCVRCTNSLRQDNSFTLRPVVCLSHSWIIQTEELRGVSLHAPPQAEGPTWCCWRRRGSREGPPAPCRPRRWRTSGRVSRSARASSAWTSGQSPATKPRTMSTTWLLFHATTSPRRCWSGAEQRRSRAT